MAEIDSAVKSSDLNIFHLPLWARFYDIPFKGRGNDGNAKVLGDNIGMFLEASKSPRGGIEKSMRIKVMIDVREPLKDRVSLKIRGGQSCSIPVKYERLPMLCFFCGKLGHSSNECVDVSGDSTPEKKYRVSLRASPWKANYDDQEQQANGAPLDGGPLNGHRLFITKDLDSGRKRVAMTVDDVTCILNQVSLVNKAPDVPDDGGGLDDSLAKNSEGVLEKPDAPCGPSDGASFSKDERGLEEGLTFLHAKGASLVNNDVGVVGSGKKCISLDSCGLSHGVEGDDMGPKAPQGNKVASDSDVLTYCAVSLDGASLMEGGKQVSGEIF